MNKKRILHTHFLDVYTTPYTLENHTALIYSVETKPKSVLIVPTNENNEVFLTKEVRPVINTWVYSLPGGFVEDGESFEQAAERELFEETGLKASMYTLMNVIFPLPGLMNQRMGVVRASGTFTKENSQQEPLESISGSWHSIDSLRALFKEKERWDSQALSSLLLLLNRVLSDTNEEAPQSIHNS